MPRVAERSAARGSDRTGHRDIALRPAATAMAFVGAGIAHEVIAVPGVALGPGEALVAVELTTIAESDVLAFTGALAVPTPTVLGHESVGRIIDLGEGGAASADAGALRIGDRVVWARPQPEPARIRAHTELAGGFATHTQLPAGTVIVPVSEHVPATVLAPAAGAASMAWAAVRRASAGTDLAAARVRVHGSGLAALAAAAMAVEAGATVDIVVNCNECAAYGKRRAAATGLAVSFGATGFDGPEDVAIVAHSCAAGSAIDAVGDGGAVLLLTPGTHTASASFDVASLLRRGVTVTGVRPDPLSDLPSAVRFLSGPGLAYGFDEAVSGVRSLLRLDDALAEAAADPYHRIGVALR